MTNDEENFWRVVRILLDDVPCRLRDLFKTKFRRRYKRAWGDDRASGQFFIAKCNTRYTGQHIIDVIKQGDTAQYDCAALFTCLLYSGTGILQPTPRHGVRTHPIEDSERIDELRVMRNDMAHARSPALPGATFNQKITSFEDIYAQLHWDPTVMRRLARDPVVTAECTRLKQQLDAEKQRYSALDLMVQDHERRLRAQESMSA